MLRSISQLDVAGKTAFLRADFNVPLSGGTITETHRIDSTLPTIQFLLGRGARVLVASHLGRPGGAADPRWSLAPVARYLEDRLGRPVPLAPDCVGPAVGQSLAHPRAAGVVLLENLRFHAG